MLRTRRDVEAMSRDRMPCNHTSCVAACRYIAVDASSAMLRCKAARRGKGRFGLRVLEGFRFKGVGFSIIGNWQFGNFVSRA